MLPVFWIYPAAWLATPVGALVALHLGVVTTAIAFSLTPRRAQGDARRHRPRPSASRSPLSPQPASGSSFSMNRCPCPPPGIALIFGSVSSRGLPVRTASRERPRPPSARPMSPFAVARAGPHGGVAPDPDLPGHGMPHAARPARDRHTRCTPVPSNVPPTPTGRPPPGCAGTVEQASQPAAFFHRFPCREAVLNRMPGRDAPPRTLRLAAHGAAQEHPERPRLTCLSRDSNWPERSAPARHKDAPPSSAQADPPQTRRPRAKTD